MLMQVFTSAWIGIFYKEYSWPNWAATGICYVVFLTIITVAIFVSDKLVFKMIASFLFLSCALFLGFEIYEFNIRTENIHQRLNYVTEQELHKIESSYKCCGKTGPADYAHYPKSCCGFLHGVHLCPYIHGCEKPYYYWESLKETWRFIGDFLKFVFMFVMIYFCFSQSMKSKEEEQEDDDENSENMYERNFVEEDLWLIEDNRKNIYSEKTVLPSQPSVVYQDNNEKRSDGISDAFDANKVDFEQFESCYSVGKVCPIRDPADEATTVTVDSNVDRENNETLQESNLISLNANVVDSKETLQSNKDKLSEN